MDAMAPRFPAVSIIIITVFVYQAYRTDGTHYIAISVCIYLVCGNFRSMVTLTEN